MWREPLSSFDCRKRKYRRIKLKDREMVASLLLNADNGMETQKKKGQGWKSYCD